MDVYLAQDYQRLERRAVLIIPRINQITAIIHYLTDSAMDTLICEVVHAEVAYIYRKPKCLDLLLCCHIIRAPVVDFSLQIE